MPSIVPAEVELAWKVAGVLPYFEAEPDVVSRTVVMRNRSTQIIPAEAFGPVRYECGASMIEAAEPKVVTEAPSPPLTDVVDRWLLRGDLPRWWREDVAMRAALTRNLGEKGILLYIHTLHEMRRISVLGHLAGQMWYAARFGVAEQGKPPRTIISLWDNGDLHTSAEAMRLFWGRDVWRQWQPNLRYSQPSWLVPGSVIIPAVTGMFGGRLTVVSGENRMDVSRAGVRWSTVTSAGGNHMLVDVPHVLPRTKAARSLAEGQPERSVHDEDPDHGSKWANQAKPEPRSKRR